MPRVELLFWPVVMTDTVKPDRLAEVDERRSELDDGAQHHIMINGTIRNDGVFF